MSDVTPTHALSPGDPAVARCPYEYYADLHRDEAAARDEGPLGWIVAGNADLISIGKDPKRFSSSFYGPEGPKLTGVSPEPLSDEVQALLAELQPMANALFSVDPPTHTRQKAIAVKSLNAERIRALEPLMLEESNRLIDAFIERGSCEFITEFAIWLPLSLICQTLGCERSEMPRYKVWTDHLADGYLSVLDNEQRLAVLQSVREFQDYFIPRIEQRRVTPTGDLLSALVNTELEAGDEALVQGELVGPRKLTDNEVLPALSQLLAAGNHTTTNLLGNLIVSLVENPEQMQALRSDPSQIPQAIEESLRRDAPLRCTYRVATEEVDVGGTTIAAGSLVPVLWGGAGHDPELFDDPQAFDIGRANSKRHLSFGHGPHFCPGSQLARAQARVAFETLLSRLDEIHFPAGYEPQRVANFPFSSFEEIRLEFRRAQ
ncbi:MAG: cytochrome P450 [Solirubrobacteraceae bacterium]